MAFWAKQSGGKTRWCVCVQECRSHRAIRWKP